MNATITTGFKAGDKVQAVRGVGSKAGYPYFARGVYEATPTAAGKLVWKLVASSGWGRSQRLDFYGAVAGVPHLPTARHHKAVV